MKVLIGILFATIAAAGCATETTGAGEAVAITCAPKEASCASDPRMPAVRTTLASLGVDLDRDVGELTLVSVADRGEALAMIDEMGAANPPGPGVAALPIVCDTGGGHGICCVLIGDWFPCITW